MGDQKRSWNYRAEDSTYDLSIADIGLLLPGVYRGFDMTLDGTMILKLTHQTTGFVVTDKAGGTISDKKSAVVSKQGVVVTEDDTETLAIAVGHATLHRIDLIIMDHQYIEVAGGQLATYSVIQGTPAASPVAPAVPNPALQVIIGELYIPATTVALTDAGVVWTREAIPAISGLEENVPLKDKANIFTNTNQFNKGVGFAKGVDVDIALTAGPDLSPSIDISGDNDGIFYKIDDTTVKGQLDLIKANDLGTAIPIILEAQKDIVFKSNAGITIDELSAGYRVIVSQGGLDVNVFEGDYVFLVKVDLAWFIVNIWRKDGALDATQASTFPLTGVDYKCISPVNDQLGNVIQAMINALCNINSTNMNGFRAEKTANQELTTDATPGTKSGEYTFDDDTTAPNFDNGNDMYVDKYIVPVDGVKQKFIAEDIEVEFTTGSAQATTWKIGIYVDGTLAAGTNSSKQFSVAVLTDTVYIPSVITDYLTLNAGQEVTVLIEHVTGGAGGKGLTVKTGAKFSNSFE